MNTWEGVQSDLKGLQSITAKLQYFADVKRSIDDTLDEQGIGLEFEKGDGAYFAARSRPTNDLLEDLYPGIDGRVIHPLLLPIDLLDEHFPNRTKNPEYTFWLLKYNAQWLFDYILYRTKHLKAVLNSPTAKSQIEGILYPLNKFAEQANELEAINKISVNGLNDSIEDGLVVSRKYSKEIAFIRIKDEKYYEEWPLSRVEEVGGDDTVDVYARYKILKEFLESHLSKISRGSKRGKESREYYNSKAICIAYYAMDMPPINKSNAADILKEHSKNRSIDKFLQQRITSRNSKKLTSVSGHKSTDTKHKQTLEAAERLVISMKNEKGKRTISQIIKAFQTSYDSQYN